MQNMQDKSFTTHTVTFANRIVVVLRDRNGKVKQVTEGKNVIVQDGLNLLACAMGQSGVVGAGAQWMGIGEDSGPIASTDVALSTEVGSRQKCTYSHNASAATWHECVAFGSGIPAGGGSIRQVAMWTSATGGLIFGKGSLSQCVIKATGDTMNVGYTFSLNST